MPGRPKRKAKQETEALIEAAESPMQEGALRHGDAPLAASNAEQRVDYIAGVMASGRWRGYLSRVELAERWGVKEPAVRHYSAEASRVLKRDPEEVERRKAELAAWCDSVRDHAMTHTSFVSGLPDYGSALKATELMAKFEGIELDTKRLEFTGKGGAPLIQIKLLGEDDDEPEKDDSSVGS